MYGVVPPETDTVAVPSVVPQPVGSVPEAVAVGAEAAVSVVLEVAVQPPPSVGGRRRALDHQRATSNQAAAAAAAAAAELINQ